MYYHSFNRVKALAMIDTKQRVKNIIKYNTSRKYFGEWSPHELNNTYFAMQPVMFKIGKLSVDIICNAIWKEMSYNPKRFGTKSPFEFNGKNSLYFFTTSEIDSESKAFNVLQKVQMYLSKFLTLAVKYDENFAANKCFTKTFIAIKNTPQQSSGSKPIPCDTYQMLSYLRNCIHIVASQNIEDFKKRQYRDCIIDYVLGTNHCAENKKVPHTDSENKKYMAEKHKIESEIAEKTAEISVTQSRIDSLTNDFENSGDTTNEIARLQQQTATLTQLEQRLQNLVQNHKQY